MASSTWSSLVLALTVAFVASVASVALPKPAFKLPSEQALARARAVLDDHPIIDGHNDFPMALRELLQNDISGLNFNSNLSESEPWASYDLDHTDLPRLRAGKVGGQFWSAFFPCTSQYKDAVQAFLEQVDVIRRLTAANADHMVMASGADDIEAAFAEGRLASLIGVESGHALGSSTAILRILYDLGARYVTLTHNCHTPWADAVNADQGEPARHDGLSAFGVTLVQEMNRLGMLVDLSHVSEATMLAAMDASQAPVIFSHSSARGVYDHARNVPDSVLERMVDEDGLVMVTFVGSFLAPGGDATIYDVVAHINHVRRVAGVDHIGLGSDYCGTTSIAAGLEDSSTYPNLFAALLEDTTEFEWTDEDLGKLASGNLLRVLRRVEAVRDLLASEVPKQTWIPEEDFEDGERECSTTL